MESVHLVPLEGDRTDLEQKLDDVDDDHDSGVELEERRRALDQERTQSSLKLCSVSLPGFLLELCICARTES